MAGLSDFPASAVLRAEDLARAKDFYTNVLGLDAVTSAGVTDEVRFLAGNGTTVDIYARPGMPAPQNTVLGFSVPADRFDSVMADLRQSGVRFEDYDIPEIGLKTVNGIAETGGSKAAWFLDTEGNTVIVGSE